MERRPFKTYKVNGSLVPLQKPKRELPARRKSFGPKSRTSSLRKKEIPPLTPLHRLKRFKAIRDKNLRKNIFQVKNLIGGKMESEVVNEQEQIYSKNVSSDTITTAAGKNEEVEQPAKTGIINGQGVHIEETAQSEEHKTKELNGNVITNGQNGHAPSENMHDDEREIIFENHHHIEKMNEKDRDKEKGDPNKGSDDLPHEKNVLADQDEASSSSESTFTSSNKEFLLRISSEDLSEGCPNKEDISEEENDIDIEGTSSTEDEKASEVSKSGEIGIEEEEKNERNEYVKEKKYVYEKEYLPSVSSASSYKTAYGSISRISGRRGMVRGRKRKAEEDLESRSSLSQPSPGWRFVPSAFSKLWSPSSIPDILASSAGVATPSRNIEDSMAVNYNEDSINFNIDDDLFSDTKDTPPSSKKSRWGCNIM